MFDNFIFIVSLVEAVVLGTVLCLVDRRKKTFLIIDIVFFAAMILWIVLWFKNPGIHAAAMNFGGFPGLMPIILMRHIAMYRRTCLEGIDAYRHGFKTPLYGIPAGVEWYGVGVIIVSLVVVVLLRNHPFFALLAEAALFFGWDTVTAGIFIGAWSVNSGPDIGEFIIWYSLLKK